MVKKGGRTPVTQVFKEIIGDVEQDRSRAGKYTVQKPFEFETGKRLRLQQDLAANELMENDENEEANAAKVKSATQKDYEPLCLQV